MHTIPSEINNKKYPAKVLLLGEYTILLDGQALAVPFPVKFVQWNQGQIDQRLVHWLKYLEQQHEIFDYLDLPKMAAEVTKDQYLWSNIPSGYGLGSSGAATAAVFDRYAYPNKKKIPLTELKTVLGIMESHFHGKSSGLDPLVSYLNEAVLVKSKTEIEILNWHEIALNFELLDSGMPRSTAKWVTLFHEKSKQAAWLTQVQNKLLPQVNKAILELRSKDHTSLYQSLSTISTLQLELMPEFIPDGIRQQWVEALTDPDCIIKLCGAGGGGYFLKFNLAAQLKQ